MDFAALIERGLVLLQSVWVSFAGRFGVSAILDILIVALVLYWLLSLISGTSAATLVRAAQQLAERRFGALLVIERSTPLGEYASRGIAMDALLSTDLLLNIFWPNSPLHDGAVILHGDRVVAAGVVLPPPTSPTADH